MKLVTYLNYGGNCLEAFRFYEKHLGAKITTLMTYAEAPLPKPNPGMKDAILHARLELGGAVLMASDVPPEANYQPMRSAYLSLEVDSAAEARRIYDLLKEGGQVFMPLEENFFAFDFAMLRDRFGTSWMIARTRPMQ